VRHSSLVSFLNGERLADQFWHDIEAEVTDCLTARSKGDLGHVIITDGPETLIIREHADMLLSALAEGRLPLEAASYIADALIMSDDFDFADEGVSDALFYLSDQSAPPSQHEVEALRSRLTTWA